MAFAATRVMEVVIKRSGGLVWKNWPMNHTRRANAKKRHVRLQQVEAVLKACATAPPSSGAQSSSNQKLSTETQASKRSSGNTLRDNPSNASGKTIS